MGLLWKVVAAEELEEETRSLVESLASRSAPAVRLAKRAMTSRLRRQFLEELAEVEALYREHFIGTETVKRKPASKGR